MTAKRSSGKSCGLTENLFQHIVWYSGKSEPKSNFRKKAEWHLGKRWGGRWKSRGNNPFQKPCPTNGSSRNRGGKKATWSHQILRGGCWTKGNFTAVTLLGSEKLLGGGGP